MDEVHEPSDSEFPNTDSLLTTWVLTDNAETLGTPKQQNVLAAGKRYSVRMRFENRIGKYWFHLRL
jgi:hypothetical protein